MRIVALLLLTGGLALAQLDTDTITVIATQRLILPQPDEFALSLYVTSGGNVGLDDVLGALPGVGVTADSLTLVRSAFGGGTADAGLTWVFQVSLPLSQMSRTLRALQSLHPDEKLGLGLTYSVYGSVSQSAQTAQPCVLTTLIADARAGAEKTAAAAGLRVGPLIQFTDGRASTGVPDQTVPDVLYSFWGSPACGPPGFVTPPFTATRIATCAAVVQFKLLR